MNAAQMDITRFTHTELETMYPIEIDAETGVVWDSVTYTEYENLEDWAANQDDVPGDDEDGEYTPSFVKRQRPIRDQY